MVNICSVFRMQQNGEEGYIAVVAPNSNFPKCSSYEEIKSNTNKRLKAYKFLGQDFGKNFIEFDGSVVRSFMCETVESKNRFGMYIKYWNKDRSVNPYKFDNVVIDLPYVYLDNKCVAEWVPIFDIDFSYESFNIVSDGAIVEYYYKRQVFVLEQGEPRHKPKNLEERLIIDIANSRITREIHKVTLSAFVSSVEHIDKGSWVLDSNVALPIIGYKSMG